MDLDSNEMEKTFKIDDELDVEGHFTTDMIFPSKDCLVEWVRNVASGLGFVATIQRADKIDGRPKPRVFVGCDRSGFARDNQQRKGYVCKNLRKTSSKRCGCKFLLLGQKMAYAEEWKITVKCGLHNHKFVHLEAHSFAGRLDDEEQKIVEEMYSSGVKPRKILSSLKKRDSSNVSIMRTIYNEKVKLFKKELDGGTPIQFLYKCIGDEKYTSYNYVNPFTSTLESIFFAHPTSIQLSNMFSDVFLMDCTYKTNRYRLPLLSIVGQTSTNLTFFAAFSFISNETEGSYKWALECFKSMLEPSSLPNVLIVDREMALMKAIKVVFPHVRIILCQVHINRNILAHCKKYFKKGKECEATQTKEPLMPLRLKGRPIGSKKKCKDDYKSTKRELSLFEHVLLGEVKVKDKPKKLIPRRNSNPKRFLKSIIDDMPSFITNHVIDAINVLGDGHCGYRVVSQALQMRDNWLQVRQDLLQEMKKNQDKYNDIYGIVRVKELLASLDCTTSPAPLDKWMTMPDMGLVISSCYNVMVVHISKFQSFTFLPLHSAPTTVKKTIYIGFVNNNHCIQLIVQKDCPLPPVISLWMTYHSEIAAEWNLSFEGQDNEIVNLTDP